MSVPNPPNIWAGYVPPRGQCNFKQGIVSGRCPCLRFMLHPLKSTSSFECDGCGHHASFHSMENKEEDAIRKRWEQEARDKALREQQEARPRKRLREIEYGGGDVVDARARMIEGSMIAGEETASEAGSVMALAKPKGRGRRKAKAVPSPPARGPRAEGKVTGIAEGDDEYIELD